jgi:signal transduction histidine kinase/CheY-like chemotaxis protein
MSTVNLNRQAEKTPSLRLTPSRAAILGLSAYVLVYVSWQLFGWIPGSRQDVGDLLIVPVDAAAVCAAWWASRRCAQVERLRSFWRMMAIALAAEMIGDIVQAIYEVGFHSSAYPSLADPFYLAFYALLLLALLRVPVAAVTRGKLIRTMLDGATIVVGGGAVVWYFVLGPTALQSGESTLAMGVSLAFPVGDLLLLAGLAAVLLRRSPLALRTPLALITGAVVLGIVADVFYGYGQLHETFTAGDWIDTIYVLEFTTFALAGLSQRPVSRGEPSTVVDAYGRHRSRASWLPYLSLAIGLGVLLGVEAGNRFFPDVSLVLIVIVLAVLVAARQYLAQRELIETEAALRKSERVKDEFISVVGHELRTPLTSIRGSLGLLQGGVFGELPEEAQSMLALAVTNTDRLVRLINDILDIERMDAGRVELALAPVKASELLENAVQIVQMTATQASVTLAADVQADVTVSVDSDRILQVLVNLLGNAIKFSPRSSTITIRVTSEQGQARFSVTDTGRGIPADRLESIFERFRQVDSSDAREKGGSGLGLAIARNIVEHHGGQMRVESELGQGSTFYFTLPLVSGSVTMLVCGSENGDASTGGGRLAELQAIAPAFGSGSVLVVEDDPSLGEVLTETLGHQEIVTRLVRTAQDAVQEIRRSQPSVLLLDLMLPDEDGFTVIERLRGDGLLSDTHLLVYTALDLSQGDRERLQLGHTEFLSKANITPQDIERRVSELLQGQHEGAT